MPVHNVSKHRIEKPSKSDSLPSDSWWKREPIYQVYPRSFCDWDGDGVGDLKGLIEKLDYFEWLGIRNLWLTPIYKSPMADFGYDVSDYCDIDSIFGHLDDFKQLIAKMHAKGMHLIMDFVPNHTSNQHPWFQASLRSEEPFKDFYVWHDGKFDATTGLQSFPNNWQSCFGGASWTWSPERQQYYYHSFLRQQPNLNYRNRRVVDEILKAMKFWLDLGVDGFRLDAVNHMSHDAEFRDNGPPAELEDTPQADEPSPAKKDGREKEKKENEITRYDIDQPEVYEIVHKFVTYLHDYGRENGRYVVAISEAYTSLENLTKYYRNGVDLPFNFSLIPWTSNVAVSQLAEWIKRFVDVCIRNKPAGQSSNVVHRHHFWPNWVVSNHDNKRIGSRLAAENNAGMVDLANMFLLLLPGTPVCYYGDELGMLDVPVPIDRCQDPAGKSLGPEKYLQKCRDPCRAPMPWNSAKHGGFILNERTDGSETWLPLPDNFEDICVEKQRLDEKSHLNFFKKLLKLRHSHAVFTYSGENVQFTTNFRVNGTEIRDDNFKILAFFRYIAHDEDKRLEKSLPFSKFLIILNFGPSTSNSATGEQRSLTFDLDADWQPEATLVLQTPNVAHYTKLGEKVPLNDVKIYDGQGLILELEECRRKKRKLNSKSDP